MGIKKLATLVKDNMTSRNGKMTLLAVGAVVASNTALAFTTPAAGSAGYELYDLVITDGLQGVPGFVGGAWLLAQAGQMMKESVWKAGLQAAGGAAIIKAEAVLGTLGAMNTNVM